MLHRFVLLSFTAISTAVATFEARKAGATTRVTTTSTADYASDDREKDERDDDDCCYDGPPKIVSL
jgi:hypothetical protein